jgi:hypothetical protein
LRQKFRKVGLFFAVFYQNKKLERFLALSGALPSVYFRLAVFKKELIKKGMLA